MTCTQEKGGTARFAAPAAGRVHVGIIIGLILFLGMMALFNGINRLVGDVRQTGWGSPLTRKSIMVSFAGLALLVLGLFGVWIHGHLK